MASGGAEGGAGRKRCTPMVNIYLNVDGSPVSLLTIPNSEAERLSIHPFKWLRYVMYSICGARGGLSATPDGPSVAYNTTSLADVIDLYYNPSGEVYFLYVRKLLITVPISPGNCIFVDYEGLNDQSRQLIRHHAAAISETRS